MSIREDFNKEAMEKKIKLNCEKGFTMDGIKKKLKEEMLSCMRNIEISEKRCVELSDQIKYIEELYG